MGRSVDYNRCLGSPASTLGGEYAWVGEKGTVGKEATERSGQKQLHPRKMGGKEKNQTFLDEARDSVGPLTICPKETENLVGEGTGGKKVFRRKNRLRTVRVDPPP